MTEAPKPYTDQRWRMVLLGVIELGLAALAGLAAVTMSVTAILSGGITEATPVPNLLGGVVVYSFAVVVFTILGIGSFLARRWARRLNLVVGWIWMVTGLFALTLMMMTLPRMMSNMPATSNDPVLNALPLILTGGCMSIIYIAVPLVILVLASGRSVRLTTEYRNPPDWSEHAPLPVLGLAVYFAFGGLSALGSLLNPVMPLFGTVLSGVPVIILALITSTIALITAYGLYQLRPAAWWAAVLLAVAGVVVSYPTVMMLDIRRLYVEMGLWSSEMEQMGIADIFHSPFFLIALTLMWILWFAYLAWIRKWFRSAVE